VRTRLTLLSIVVVGTIITLLRVPVAHLDTIWAEDGDLFLKQYLDGSAWPFRGYAGYQHLIPRIVTGILATIVPLEWYGIAVFVACAILTGAVGAAVFWLSRDLVPWMPARLGLAGITFLLPLSAVEVIGNLADFHTYCLWLMPWLLLYRPRTPASGIGWGVVAFVCAMTEIQSLVFLPLLVFMLPRQHRFAWPIGVGYLLGIAGQVITTLLLPRPSNASWLGFPSLLLGYLYNTVLPMVSPNTNWQVTVLLESGALVPALALLPFVVASIVVLVWGTRMQRTLVVTLVLASGAIYAAGALIDGNDYFLYAHHTNANGFEGMLSVRYGVASGFFLAATVPLAAAVLVRLGASRGVRWPSIIAWVAVVGLLVQFGVASTQASSARTTGVSWSENVEEARDACANYPPETVVGIETAPVRVLLLDCGELVP